MSATPPPTPAPAAAVVSAETKLNGLCAAALEYLVKAPVFPATCSAPRRNDSVAVAGILPALSTAAVGKLIAPSSYVILSPKPSGLSPSLKVIPNELPNCLKSDEEPSC